MAMAQLDGMRDVVFGPKKKFKALVVGESKSGKTSVVRRLVNDYFPKSSTPADVGLQCHYKAMLLRDTPVLLEVWDNPNTTLDAATVANILGRDKQHTPVGAAVLCDISKPKIDVDGIMERKRELERIQGQLPLILLANKVDVGNPTEEQTDVLDRVCRAHGFQGWFPTSAKNGQGVQMAFSFLTVKMLDLSAGGTASSGAFVDFCSCS